MNIFRRFTFLTALIAVVSLSGCSEDEEQIEPIVGVWQKTKQEQRTGSGTWATSTKSCQLDDTEEYAAGGKWTVYDGPNQCSAGTGIIKGTWKLTASGSKVVYTYEGYSGEYESTVESMDGTTLVLVNAVGDVNNTQVRTTYTRK